jgi:hypothetical protein
LKLLEDAASFLVHQITEKIWDEMNKIGEEWIDKQKWSANFEGEEDWTVAPNNWLSEPKKINSAFARFEVDAGEGDDYGDTESYAYFDLTRFCGIKNEMGLRFKVHPQELGISKPKWRQYLIGGAKPFQEKGFKIEEKNGCLFWPLRIEQESLIKAWDEDSFDEVLRPFSEKLEWIKKSISMFDKLIDGAKKEGKRSAI